MESSVGADPAVELMRRRAHGMDLDVSQNRQTRHLDQHRVGAAAAPGQAVEQKIPIVRKLSRHAQKRCRLSTADRRDCSAQPRGVRGPGRFDMQPAVESHQENLDIGRERLLDEVEKLFVDRLARGPTERGGAGPFFEGSICLDAFQVISNRIRY